MIIVQGEGPEAPGLAMVLRLLPSHSPSLNEMLTLWNHGSCNAPSRDVVKMGGAELATREPRMRSSRRAENRYCAECRQAGNAVVPSLTTVQLAVLTTFQQHTKVPQRPSSEKVRNTVSDPPPRVRVGATQACGRPCAAASNASFMAVHMW